MIEFANQVIIMSPNLSTLDRKGRSQDTVHHSKETCSLAIWRLEEAMPMVATLGTVAMSVESLR